MNSTRSRIRNHGLALAAFALAAVLPASTRAAPVLDQYNTAPYDGLRAFGVNSLNNSVALGQTFVAGASGVLSSVDVFLTVWNAAVEPVVLELRSTTGGIPNAGIAPIVSASAFGSGSSIPTLVTLSFDLLAANVSVTAGTMYALVLRTSNCGDVRFCNVIAWTDTNAANAYPAGREYSSTNGFQFSALGSTNSDLRFATYVDAPEPTMATLIAGFAVALLLGRRG